MDILVESSGALAVSVARGHGEAAASWARWTATMEAEPPQGSFARSMAWRIVTRGPLVPPEPEFEIRLRRRLGERAGEAALITHRLQSAWLLCNPSGRPSRPDADLSRTGRFTFAESAWLAREAAQDLSRLLDDLSTIYPQSGPSESGAAFVSWSGARKPGRTSVWIGEGAGECAVAPNLDAPRTEFHRNDEALASLANRLFAVPNLRPGQADGVAALLEGRDLCARMPTGGGKSLVFQLAAVLAPGTAVVVAPLRALLRDQRRRMAEAGIGKVALLTGDDAESTRRGLLDLSEGKLIMALAAPERLDSPSFRTALRRTADTVGVSFVAVDEAQCAARRGPDWRPAYRVLGARLRDWAATDGGAPALGAFSGAASSAAVAEAQRALVLRDPVRVDLSGARTNLAHHVGRGRDQDHLQRLRELLTRRIPRGRFGPGIIFCPRVDGPLGAATIAEELAWSEGIDAAAFTGRAPAGVEESEWTAMKKKTAENFLTGRRGLICATRAFGLGVHRHDVRFTVHVGLPSSLEEYEQQAGRAGRDGGSAQCWIIFQLRDVRRAARFARARIEDLRHELAFLAPSDRDDVTRAYQMHLAAFPGAAAERRDVEVASWGLGNLSESGRVIVSVPGGDEDALTRALVRLETVGILRMESRLASAWVVDKLGDWSAEAAKRAVEQGIEKDYELVEPVRRASLAELVERASTTTLGFVD